jgi:hypothetical protein
MTVFTSDMVVPRWDYNQFAMDEEHLSIPSILFHVQKADK